MSGYKNLLNKLGLRKKKGATQAEQVEATIETLGDAERCVHWASHGETLVMKMPVGRLVMQGALQYADALHPFRAALSQGIESLRAYYEAHCPASFCEFHRVAPASSGDATVPVWELPWLHRVRRVPPPGEGGLGPEHGLSYCGPVTPQKVALEYQRLSTLAERVRGEGYLPQAYGHIAGFFMVDDDGGYRFFVRGGKHRTAVLAHLGWDTVPVTFKRDWPRVVREAQCRCWPLVQNGGASETVARAAFRRYTQ